MASASSPPGKPERKAFALRLSPAIYAAIERLAASEFRSVNAEIEVLLREALKARGISSTDGVDP